ncbi:G_PROTEIN_RECEP_F1_2 domain-containing protein [Meloidogyne graminicola]|uniref:G_PROTEIN_RECEP_F1_2 domain-containing protein n=1 Tax=Meloidogyne graminicola TaxID=189291 RepID=A0A8S9ZYB6_9BILA|nr:G_PROTEIN_RECEP_F1_2 domain-containing protein [Meloidogyne graminicola]
MNSPIEINIEQQLNNNDNSPKNIINFNEQQSNWTEMDCGWLDEIRDIQNHFYWRHTNPALLLCLYATVCFFGALANLFVLLSFAKVAQLRNLRNYFIANLAFSDLLMCTITAPVTLYLSLNFFWPFGKFACQLVASIQAVLIAMDRFLLTLCPVKWRLAAKAPLICYLFVWICSFIVAAPYGAAVSAEYAKMLDPWNSANVELLLPICDREQPQICMEDVKRWDRLPFSRKTYTLRYLLPLSALAIAYSQIGSTIRRRGKASTTIHGERKQQIQRRNRKAMILLLGLVLVYAIAWAPMNIYNVLHVLELIAFSQYNYLFCHLLGMVSAFLNPLLYALINEAFRSAFLQLIQPLLKLCFFNFQIIRNIRELTNNNNNIIQQHETISSALIQQKKIETPPTKRTTLIVQNEEENNENIKNNNLLIQNIILNEIERKKENKRRINENNNNNNTKI